MKSLVRAVVFVVISLTFTQYVFQAFEYGGNSTVTFLLIVLGLSLLFYIVRPILKIISLPFEGLGYLVLMALLTFAVLYILTLFIPAFTIKSVSLSGLNILGFMLPSKELSAFWATFYSALLVSLVYNFLQGLCSRK
jgi:uncharacterized membrane protein YvlD (DUF360 family)